MYAVTVTVTGEEREVYAAATTGFLNSGVIYDLMIKREAETSCIVHALGAWIYVNHVIMAMHYSEYNPETEEITLLGKSDVNNNTPVQDTISKGLLDTSILKPFKQSKEGGRMKEQSMTATITPPALHW